MEVVSGMGVGPGWAGGMGSAFRDGVLSPTAAQPVERFLDILCTFVLPIAVEAGEQ